MQPESITAKVARFTGTGVNGSSNEIHEQTAVSAVNRAQMTSFAVRCTVVLRLLPLLRFVPLLSADKAVAEFNEVFVICVFESLFII